jgi:peroxiredoxin
VAFIAAQKIDGLFKGKQYVQKHAYPIPILFDETRTVTRAYGVYQAIGIDTINLARRATFVIDADGRISWIGVSPHQREAPTIQEILSAIEACGKY